MRLVQRLLETLSPALLRENRELRAELLVLRTRNDDLRRLLGLLAAHDDAPAAPRAEPPVRPTAEALAELRRRSGAQLVAEVVAALQEPVTAEGRRSLVAA